MKIAVVLLLAFLGLATAEQDVETFGFADRSLSSLAVTAIENIRDELPCGFPEFGIPPLAPLKIPHKEVNIDTESFQLKGVVENFRLNGLDDFDISEMKINAITSKVNFRFIFRNVNVDTKYDLRLLLKKAGFTINLIGNGPAKFAIKNLDIKGAVKYSLGVLSRKLKLKVFQIRTHIGEIESDIKGILGEGDINEKWNDILSEVVEQAVNDNENTITETIESHVLPVANDYLSQTTLTELVSSIGGNGEDKEKCIPPSE